MRAEGSQIERGKERPPDGNVGAVVCMDDAAHFDGIKFGFVASLVTEKGAGNQKLFPDNVREIIAKNREIIFRSLNKVSKKLNIFLGATSHPGCGGAALQEIDNQRDLNDLTKVQSETAGLKYIGCLPVAMYPTYIESSGDLFGYMARRPDEHTHKNAAYVDITVGGGIDDRTKIQRAKKRGGKEAFELSADWIAYALKEGISDEDIDTIFRVQIGIAKALIEKAGNEFKGVHICDAEKLGNNDGETVKNTQFIKDLLSETI